MLTHWLVFALGIVVGASGAVAVYVVSELWDFARSLR